MEHACVTPKMLVKFLRSEILWKNGAKVMMAL